MLGFLFGSLSLPWIVGVALTLGGALLFLLGLLLSVYRERLLRVVDHLRRWR